MTDGPSPRTAASGLGLWDAVNLIVGIVIGVTIFRVPGLIAGNAGSPWLTLAVWTLGGVLSFIGALCYAELASTFPRVGGDYVFLTRAYGRPIGFLFGWSHLAGILTGSIGALAFVFADYTVPVFGVSEGAGLWFAIGSVAWLTLVNLLGVVFSKTAQNVLTATKMLGLAVIAYAGIFHGSTGFTEFAGGVSQDELPSMASAGFAMILVLYAFGGWNDSAFVAADVQNPQRNVPRALLLGVSLITAMYILVNLGYLAGLGFEGLKASKTPAADLLKPLFGGWGSRLMGVLVMVSALGALNGLILTGSRVHAGMGADHRVFRWLGWWHPRTGAPIFSLLAQFVVAVGLMFGVGTKRGRDAIDRALQTLGGDAVEWDRFGGGFDALVSATAPVFWTFFLLTGISLIVLRFREPDVDRPFRVPLFPATPIAFCGVCIYMLYSSINWAGWLSAVVLIPLAIGVPLYFLSEFLRVEDAG